MTLGLLSFESLRLTKHPKKNKNKKKTLQDGFIEWLHCVIMDFVLICAVIQANLPVSVRLHIFKLSAENKKQWEKCTTKHWSTGLRSKEENIINVPKPHHTTVWVSPLTGQNSARLSG